MKQWKCTVCGKIFEGDAPPVPCPVCHAPQEAFVEVTPAPPAAAKWRCVVCGQVFDGAEPPVPCPVCGAGRDSFERLEAAATAYRNDTDDRYVIVGGGVAALEAAKAIRKRNATGSILILSSERYAPYNRPSLSGILESGAACDSIGLEKADFYRENNIELRCSAMVQAVDLGKKLVLTAEGEELRYTKLLLATGANPFNPIETNPDSIPVKVLRSYDDAVGLAEAARGKRVVLVGGGILGLEAALALHRLGSQVTVVEFAPRILPLQTDEHVSALLRSKLEALGIVVMTGTSVSSATAEGVAFTSGAEMSADLVLASMGVRSEISLAVNMGLELGRGIVVDEHMRTSHEDVWAAGDCAEFAGRVQAMAGAAAGMGAAAGASMAGDNSEAYAPFTPATSFGFEGFGLFSIGEVGQEPEAYALYQDAAGESYRRLFLRDGRLAGALFANSNPGARAARAVADGLPLAEALALLA